MYTQSASEMQLRYQSEIESLMEDKKKLEDFQVENEIKLKEKGKVLLYPLLMNLEDAMEEMKLKLENSLKVQGELKNQVEQMKENFKLKEGFNYFVFV
jgi:hypothetical protein